MSGKDASTSSVAIATAVPSPAEHKMQKEEDLTVFVADLMDQMVRLEPFTICCC
jgi:hypothetical protein